MIDRTILYRAQDAAARSGQLLRANTHFQLLDTIENFLRLAFDDLRKVDGIDEEKYGKAMKNIVDIFIARMAFSLGIIVSQVQRCYKSSCTPERHNAYLTKMKTCDLTKMKTKNGKMKTENGDPDGQETDPSVGNDTRAGRKGEIWCPFCLSKLHGPDDSGDVEDHDNSNSGAEQKSSFVDEVFQGKVME